MGCYSIIVKIFLCATMMGHQAHPRGGAVHHKQQIAKQIKMEEKCENYYIWLVGLHQNLQKTEH